ncbi:MAG: D-alanine--D-alanine ligase [Candidatus Fermentibacteraceae bacterium]|nr:D-alanine--D-alanine ligase [Candidatus Fermentibacteraceae bacterium]
MKILLLSGGRSAEREISMQSALFVRSVLEQSGHEIISVEISENGLWFLDLSTVTLDTGHSIWKLFTYETEIEFDVVFPVLHGPWGEDGTIQGLCEIAGWPYTGADVMTSSLAMNKVTTKRLASSDGIPVVPWKSFSLNSPPSQNDLEPLRYPLFVKPVRMGSSVGISRIDTPEQLQGALELAFRYDSLILIENGLANVREIEVALLTESGSVISSVPGEIVPGLEWYDYTAKYDCIDSKLIIPASLSDKVSNQIRVFAEKVFSLLYGSGYARADFLLIDDDEIYFNEINTIPGFTEISMFSKLWEASGKTSSEIMEQILAEALRKYSKPSQESELN